MTIKSEILALDREPSKRAIDQDGHLHVQDNPISKAQVDGYKGAEIPDWRKLGLDPDRLYQLLRDPHELEKAAPTFEGKPLHGVHRPQTADDHDGNVVVGSVDTVRWDPPYLRANLHVWPGDAIGEIQSGEKKEISSGYRYEPDMTPGTYEGQRYDGVMRNIQGNHVSLVERGRAGPDVVIGDSAIPPVKETARMAQSKKVLTRRAAAARNTLISFLKPQIAADAELGDVVALLDKLEGGAPEAPGVDPGPILTRPPTTATLRRRCVPSWATR